METFIFEGELLRVRSLGTDSGVLDAHTPHVVKWVLEHNLDGMWYRDAYVLLPFSSTVEEAKKRLGF